MSKFDDFLGELVFTPEITTKITQQVLYVEAESFERLSEILGELVSGGYFINQVIETKDHSHERGDIYKAVVIASVVENE